MEPSTTPSDEQRKADAQKLIGRILRLTGLAFFAGGVLTLVMGGDIILGSVLTLIGLTDIVLVPHIIEKAITEKLKHRNDQE